MAERESAEAAPLQPGEPVALPQSSDSETQNLDASQSFEELIEKIKQREEGLAKETVNEEPQEQQGWRSGVDDHRWAR